MRSTSLSRLAVSATLLATAAVIGACADGGVTTPGTPVLHTAAQRGANQAIELCKVGPVGRYNFTVEVSPTGTGSLPATSTLFIDVVTEGVRTCHPADRVWESGPNQSFDVNVKITEQVPPGMEVSKIEEQTNVHAAATGTHLTPQPNTAIVHPGSPTFVADFDANPAVQVLKFITFYNGDSPPPPPTKQDLTVCKYGPSAQYQFAISATGGTLQPVASGGTFVVAQGTCVLVWTAEPAVFADVTVTETVPPNEQPDSINTFLSENGGASNQVDHDEGSVSHTYQFVDNGRNSSVVEKFYNSTDEVLGVQGCTPGYWKQQHHFGSWTSTGLHPTDSYNTTFGVTAWPATFTLLDALKQGGGGINRLARHSTAALLDARSTGVAYGMSSQEVILRTRAAIASRNYDSASDVFEPFNEQGCPLGRAP